MTINGCCAATSIRRYVRVAADGASNAKAEMFAIDWVQVQDGQFSSGDGSRSEDYFGFGAEVRSVVDGTVVYVRDGMPEQTPGAITGIELPEDLVGTRSWSRSHQASTPGMPTCRPAASPWPWETR